MTRPWVVVIDGHAQEHPTARAALDAWTASGAITCEVVGPKSKLYHDLDASIGCELLELPRRSDAATSAVSPGTPVPAVETAGFGVPGSTDPSRARTSASPGGAPGIPPPDAAATPSPSSREDVGRDGVTGAPGPPRPPA